MAVTLHTSLGNLKIEVFWDRVPLTAKNFLGLCAAGYYNGVKFHRNIRGFVIQTGDPTGTGRGGDSIYGKPFQDEILPDLKHSTRGIVSMANSGPNSNKSQFFITYGKHSHLNGKNTVFGKVIQGLEVLELMENQPNVEGTQTPRHDIVIHSVTIHSNPIAELES